MVSTAVVTMLAWLAGAESDQYYAWFEEIPDGADALNHRVRTDLAARLAEVNAHHPEHRSCTEVADALLTPYFTTGTWFVIGATKEWGVPYRPANATERIERYAPRGLYRKYGLLPFGVFVPIDPSVRAGDVTFGTDKISHFLNNSWRYWSTYSAARARGDSEEHAVLAAIERGIGQEAGILGSGVASTFSYADLEANYQGLQMIRSWCEGGELALQDGAWRFTQPFEWRRWVNPCWDESFYPDAYSGLTADGVLEALHGYCAVRNRPNVARQRARYRAIGCHSFSVRTLDERIATGSLPDPTRFDVDNVCTGSPGRTPDRAYNERHDARNTPPLSGVLRSDGRGPVGSCWPRRGPQRRRRTRPTRRLARRRA